MIIRTSFQKINYSSKWYGILEINIMTIPNIIVDYHVSTHRTLISIDNQIVFDAQYDINTNDSKVWIDLYQAYVATMDTRLHAHMMHCMPRSTFFFILPTILHRRYGSEQVRQWYNSPIAPTLHYEFTPDDSYTDYTDSHGALLINDDRIELKRYLDETPHCMGALPTMQYQQPNYICRNFSTLLGFAAIGEWLNHHQSFRSDIFEQSLYPAEADDDFWHNEQASIQMTVPSLLALVDYQGHTLFPPEWFYPTTTLSP